MKWWVGLVSRAEEPLALGFICSLLDLNLEQAVADEQRRGDCGLDRLFVLAADHDLVDHGVHVADPGFVELDVLGDIERLAVDDQAAAALLAHLGQDEVEVFAVDLEDRRAELDLGSFGKRENRLEDLARRFGSGAGSPVRGQVGSPMVAKSRFR